MQRYESKLLGVRANEANGTRVVRAAIEAEVEIREDVNMARNAHDYCCDLLIRLENKAVREAARNTRTSHLPHYLDCHATNPSPAKRNRHSTSILETKRRKGIYKRGKHTLGGGSSKAPRCHRAKGRSLPLRVFCREAGSHLEVIWPCCLLFPISFSRSYGAWNDDRERKLDHTSGGKHSSSPEKCLYVCNAAHGIDLGSF